MNENLHLNVLPAEQLRLFEILGKQEWIKPFYLAGGTSLALQIGHRKSVDFDFFTLNDFSIRDVTKTVSNIGTFELFNEENNTINGSLNGVKVSFFKYVYPVLKPFKNYGNVNLAHTFDVALMKLEAISGRGHKRDFFDLYFLLKHYTLTELLNNYEKKYGVAVANQYHLIKAISYFNDAEKQESPNMIEKVSWNQVKLGIENEVKKIKWQ